MTEASPLTGQKATKPNPTEPKTTPNRAQPSQAGSSPAEPSPAQPEPTELNLGGREAAGPDAGDENLAEIFWSVARHLRRRSRTVLEPFAVTPSLARALEVLARHAPIRVSALAEHLRVAARTATELIDDLVERGLVERRPDPADRRAVLAVLTDAGATATASIRTARLTEAGRFFGVLPPADRAQLARILRTLRDDDAGRD